MIGGSSFTLITNEGAPVAFAQQVAHQSMEPRRGPGEMVLRVFEVFGSDGPATKIWNRLQGEAVPSDISVAEALLLPGFSVTKIVRSHAGQGDVWTEVFNGCEVSAVYDDPEPCGTMEILVQIGVTYISASGAWAGKA